MAEIYQCGNFGAKFCDECGTKLEWPKEKVAKVKVVKNKKAKRIVKLDVDPLAVDDLYESSLGLSVGIFFLGAGGLIITPIIWYQRYVIGKWIRNLMNPDSVPDLVATDRMIRRTKTIRSSCAVICALNILAFISALATPSKQTTLWYTYDHMPYKIITFFASIAGFIIADALSKKAVKVIRSYKDDNKYEFDREKKYTNNSENGNKNTSTQDNDPADEDFDF
ncbi:hypothetical protein IKQ74_03095 [Candidatus Saccharibacteria bacterium]|nr:hypothetical protein [Candidatus Saccharibacteria bacterium]